MKLDDCLKIGISADLETLGEALYNIHIHADNLFRYEGIENELKELEEDLCNIKNIWHEINEDTRIEEVIGILGGYDPYAGLTEEEYYEVLFANNNEE